MSSRDRERPSLFLLLRPHGDEATARCYVLESCAAPTHCAWIDAAHCLSPARVGEIWPSQSFNIAMGSHVASNDVESLERLMQAMIDRGPKLSMYGKRRASRGPLRARAGPSASPRGSPDVGGEHSRGERLVHVLGIASRGGSVLPPGAEVAGCEACQMECPSSTGGGLPR